jgi:hypothetical protein
MGKRILFGLLLLPYLSICSFAGPKDGGGGDEVGIDFQMALFESLAEIQRKNNDLQKAVSPGELIELFKQSRILVVEEKLVVEFEGVLQESAAVNDRIARIIKVNRKRWQSIADRRLKQAIALHEMLSLKQLESTGVYTYSAEFAGRFGLSAKAVATGTTPFSGYMVTCNDSTKLLDLKSKKELDVSRSSFSLMVQWRFRNQTFRLSSYFLNDDELFLQPVIDQSSITEAETGIGTAKRSSLHVYMLTSNGRVRSGTQVSETLLDDQGKLWELKDGKVGAFLGTREFRSTGGTNTLRTEISPGSMPEQNGFRVLKSEKTCVETNIPAAVFSGPKPDLLEGMITKFELAAKGLEELERADSACLLAKEGGSDQSCEKTGRAFTAAALAAENEWKKLVSLEKLKNLSLIENRQAEARRAQLAQLERKRASRAQREQASRYRRERGLGRGRGVSDATQRVLDCMLLDMARDNALPTLGPVFSRSCYHR